MANRKKRYGNPLVREEPKIFHRSGERLTHKEMRASRYCGENMLTYVVKNAISYYLSSVFESGIDYDTDISHHCDRIIHWLTEPRPNIGESCAHINYSNLVNLTAQGESSEVAKNILGYLEMRFPDEIKSLSGKHE